MIPTGAKTSLNYTEIGEVICFLMIGNSTAENEKSLCKIIHCLNLGYSGGHVSHINGPEELRRCSEHSQN